MFAYSNKGVSMPPMRMHQNPKKIRSRINDNDCAPGLRKTADLARYYRTWTLLLLLMMIPTAIGKADETASFTAEQLDYFTNVPAGRSAARVLEPGG